MVYDDILEKVYAIPHLPANKIHEGFALIQTEIDDIHRQGLEYRNELQVFATYLRTTWLPLANILSVYDNPIRTNNAAENFHLYAVKKIGVNPQVWKFLGMNLKVKFLF